MTNEPVYSACATGLEKQLGWLLAKMVSLFARCFNFRVLTMRPSLTKAVKLATRTAINLITTRGLSCTSKKQWNDNFFSGPPPWGNGSYWGLQRFLEEVRLIS